VSRSISGAADKRVAGERDLGLETGVWERTKSDGLSLRGRRRARSLERNRDLSRGHRRRAVRPSYRPQCAPHPHPTTTTVSCAPPPFQVIGLGPTRDWLQKGGCHEPFFFAKKMSLFFWRGCFFILLLFFFGCEVAPARVVTSCLLEHFRCPYHSDFYPTID
jgi:hypothetical protein